mmetsp:Transcript_21539/g.54812  ORF Transcript_21539/g.54812 Transcript_21539/m.54812 type:complete len:207 (+) Transcript_21539:861-1481(+)
MHPARSCTTTWRPPTLWWMSKGRLCSSTSTWPSSSCKGPCTCLHQGGGLPLCPSPGWMTGPPPCAPYGRYLASWSHCCTRWCTGRVRARYTGATPWGTQPPLRSSTTPCTGYSRTRCWRAAASPSWCLLSPSCATSSFSPITAPACSQMTSSRSVSSTCLRRSILVVASVLLVLGSLRKLEGGLPTSDLMALRSERGARAAADHAA